MTAEIPSFSSVLEAPRAELARLCRQICVEREKGSQAPRSYDADFQHALAEIQAHFGPTSVSEDDLGEIVRTEEKRVADAAVLADLLLPRLLSSLRSKLPPLSSSVAPQPASAAEPRRTVTTAPLGVADLLEGMLDQQRSEARNRPAARP